MLYLTVALVVALGVIGFQQYSFRRLFELEREQTARERERLLQRIQDPVSAVAMHAQEEIDSPLVRHHVDFDDDKDFTDYMTRMEG
jgi:hypothetical protein